MSNNNLTANDDLIDQHPELFHYTNDHGLKGILESRCLWATHYTGLNDSTEVTLLREQVVSAITDRQQEFLLGLVQ